jgi:hypothetical protein
VAAAWYFRGFTAALSASIALIVAFVAYFFMHFGGTRNDSSRWWR